MFESVNIIQIVIEAVILAGVGFAVIRSFNLLSKKVDTVIINQQDQNVQIAEIKKDVTAINGAAEDHKVKISKLEDRMNNAEIAISELRIITS